MRDADRFETLEDGPERELRVLGSRFLARAVHATSDEAAARAVAAARRAHHGATHVCWAVRFGPPGAPRGRGDDDGEPTGTAGRPIGKRIEAAALFDALVLVVRYFGGTKLGTGGLARAYAEAAVLALDAATRRTVVLEAGLEVRCNYDDVGAVESVLARAGAAVRSVGRAWDPSPRFTVAVARSKSEALAAELAEALAGRGSVRPLRPADGRGSE